MWKLKATHNLSATTSTYKKGTETKYRNADFGTMFYNEDKKTYSIKLSDVMTNVLKTALGFDFEWWIQVRKIKPKDEAKKNEEAAQEEDDLPF